MVGGREFGTRMLRLYLPLAVCLVLMLFPFYWMLITSIKPNRELYNARIMPMIVYQPTLKHYVDLLSETNFLTWTYNTFLVAIVSTAVSLVLGTMIAYPLARMNFPGAAVVAIGVAASPPPGRARPVAGSKPSMSNSGASMETVVAAPRRPARVPTRVERTDRRMPVGMPMAPAPRAV